MGTCESSPRRDSLSPNLGERQSQQSLKDLECFEQLPAAQAYPETPVFHHEPLQDATQQIRLCRILPGTPPLPLSVKLETYALESVLGGFWALSYAWGNSASTEWIFVNDLVLNGSMENLPQNLWTFLSRLRQIGFGRLVWVDALCIDQHNEVEKAAQVALMWSVFEGAEAVIVGLDEECISSRQAAADHRILRRSIEQLAAGCHLKDLECCSSDNTLDPEFVRVACRFLGSAWFTRVWTVQEVVLAKQSCILLADDFFSWDTFDLASRKWNDHINSPCCASLVERLDTDLIEALHQTNRHIAAINHVRNTLPNKPNILDAILCFPHLSAKLAVDQFHGFRGLHLAASPLPPPDYDRPAAKVFEDATLWLLKNCDGLIALTLGLMDVCSELPHWVANLSMRPELNPDYYRAQIELYMAYECRFSVGGDFVYNDPGKLRMNAVELDVVSQVKSEMFVEGMDTASHIKLLRKWYAFVSGRKLSEINCDSFDDQFSNLVLGGCVKAEAPGLGVRKADVADYARWRQTIADLEISPSAESLSGVSMSSHLNAVMQRRLFRSSRGFLCLGPPSIRIGDKIWLFSGGRAPFATRRVVNCGTSEPQDQLLGYCYHQGLMEKQLDVAEMVKRPTTCTLI